jgi:hypothetical protein
VGAKKDGNVFDSAEVASDKQDSPVLFQGIIDSAERRRLDASVEKSPDVRDRLIGIEKFFAVVMQNPLEHGPGDGVDFMGALEVPKSLVNGINDLSFFLCTEAIIKAAEEGDVFEGERPSHFLDERHIGLPLQKSAESFPHTSSVQIAIFAARVW